MSILSDLFKGKTTPIQALAQIEAWGAKIVGSDPTLQNAVSGVITDVKQAASTAVDMIDTAVGVAVMPAAAGVEVSLDAALATITKGGSIPFNGFVNDGIDTMAQAIKNEADAWALKAKAALATAPAPQAQAQAPGTAAAAAGAASVSQ